MEHKGEGEGDGKGEAKPRGVPPVTAVLSTLVVLLSLVSVAFPTTHQVLAMIPARTLFPRLYVWNVVTGGYFEPSLLGGCLSGIGLCVGGGVLEPRFSSWQFLRFVVLTNLAACVLTYVLSWVCFGVTNDSRFLEAHVAGFKGVIGALTVGVRQLYLDKPRRVYLHPAIPFHFSTNHLPAAYLFVSFVEECLIEGNIEEFPLTVWGLWVGWVYLRFWRVTSSGQGDQRHSFSFASFFPFPLNVAVAPVSAVTFAAATAVGVVPSVRARPTRLADIVPLAYHHPSAHPNPDAANKRRERGFQLLELRLAALQQQEQRLRLNQDDDDDDGGEREGAGQAKHNHPTAGGAKVV